MSALPVYVPKIQDAICIIPAKKISTRCPGKNTRMFHGKPMLAYSIDTARASGLFSEIIVSTDDAATFEIALAHKTMPRMREWGWDKLGTQELAAKVLGEMEVNPNRRACVIYATAPMLHREDLQMAAEQYDPLVDSFIFGVGAVPLRDAGAFYMGLADDFITGAPLIGGRSRMFVLPESRVIDINTEDDFARAVQMYAAYHEGAARFRALLVARRP